jgi:hypothetical protein
MVIAFNILGEQLLEMLAELESRLTLHNAQDSVTQSYNAIIDLYTNSLNLIKNIQNNIDVLYINSKNWYIRQQTSFNSTIDAVRKTYTDAFETFKSAGVKAQSLVDSLIGKKSIQNNDKSVTNSDVGSIEKKIVPSKVKVPVTSETLVNTESPTNLSLESNNVSLDPSSATLKITKPEQHSDEIDTNENSKIADNKKTEQHNVLLKDDVDSMNSNENSTLADNTKTEQHKVLLKDDVDSMTSNIVTQSEVVPEKKKLDLIEIHEPVIETPLLIKTNDKHSVVIGDELAADVDQKQFKTDEDLNLISNANLDTNSSLSQILLESIKKLESLLDKLILNNNNVESTNAISNLRDKIHELSSNFNLLESDEKTRLEYVLGFLILII